MTSLSVYHFPETDICRADVRGQLLFFSQIFYLRPVEDDENEQDELCPAYTPAPLGDDLQRFQQLLAELKGNEAAFYRGQLSRMALEYMEHRTPETIRDIISNLQVPGSRPSSDAIEPAKTREELWQARLLLKLAEIRRQEEKELAESLTLLAGRQDDLFNELKGEDELHELLHTFADIPRPQFSMRMEPLIKAWGQLLLAGDQQPWFLNCFSPEAAEPLFEANEKLSGQRPVRLLRLPLPDCSQDPESYDDKRQLWQDTLADCLPKTADILHDIGRHGLGTTSLADLTQMAALWTKAYDKNIWPDYAATNANKTCAIPHLEIYLLTRPIPELIAALCAQKFSTAAVGPWQHGLLAVLSSRSSTCKG